LTTKRIGSAWLALLFVILTGGCGATDQGTEPANPATQSAGGSNSASPHRNLNPLEKRIVTALSELGIQGAPAQLSMDSAQIVAPVDGSELVVTGVRRENDGGVFSVIDERQVEGVTVLSVAYEGIQGHRSRFACGDYNFEAYGSAPPGFSTFDELIPRLVSALCG
jgi:hypothetical protein